MRAVSWPETNNMVISIRVQHKSIYILWVIGIVAVHQEEVWCIDHITRNEHSSSLTLHMLSYHLRSLFNRNPSRPILGIAVNNKYLVIPCRFYLVKQRSYRFLLIQCGNYH